MRIAARTPQPEVAALLDGFLPVLLGAPIGARHGSVDAAVTAARAASRGPASAVLVVANDGAFAVHELLTTGPDGEVGGLRIEGSNTPRLPRIEQPMAGLVAVVDGVVLLPVPV